MTAVELNFDTKPSNGIAMLKALVLPRKGFDANVGLPKIKAAWKGASADLVALNDYLLTLDIEKGEYLPILYPHVMAGSMHMHMLSHKSFPIRLLGSVHLKNRITQIKAISNGAVMDITAELGAYRLVEKGVEFDFSTYAYVAGEKVWEEISTYFKAGRFGGKENPSPEKSFELESLDSPEGAGSWHVPNNRGKRYAKITGDYNPIHMSPIAAKLFGFKRDIAHGFGVLAEAIEHSASIDMKGMMGNAGGLEQSLQVDVAFKGPVFLDSDVRIKRNKAQDANRFDVYCADNTRPSICCSLKAI
jgi:acyl dehydratase